MMIGIGLDFGTSNSTIAWYDGTRLQLVALEKDSPILPTAVHLDREYAGLTGSAAIDQYAAENSGRLVQLVPEILGRASTSIEDRTTDVEMSELETSRDVVYGPLIDHGLPGRLFLGLKRLLGNPNIDRLSVFGRAYRLVALLTPIMVRIRESLQRQIGSDLGRVHVGRPVVFEGHPTLGNALAVQRLTEAYAHAGFSEIEFYPEPVAATLSFLWRQSLHASGTVLTVDFGGGTLDLSLVRYAGVEFEVLGTAGTDLGGDRIDQLIFRRVLFPLLGEGETWSRVVEGRVIETQFPFAEFEEGLLNWAITHTLNQNRYKTKIIDRIAQGGAAAVKFERLKDLINYNYSYNIFRAIKKAKAELSTAVVSVIDIPELNLSVALTRNTFDEMLAEPLARLKTLIEDVLARADTPASTVDLVVRTGGSSQIVAVKELLEAIFPGKVREHDPFTSVAAGLAIANFYGYRFGH